METYENSRAYADPPFTNEEVFRAGAVFLPEAALEAARESFQGSPDDYFQGHVTTAILLIMSTFSDELAARVLAYSPDLKPRVEEVRSDPEKYLQSLRNPE